MLAKKKMLKTFFITNNNIKLLFYFHSFIFNYYGIMFNYKSIL